MRIFLKLTAIVVFLSLLFILPIMAQDEYDPASGYHNYSTLTKALQELARRNTKITKLTSIGQTLKGRDIWALQVSGTKGGKPEDKQADELNDIAAQLQTLKKEMENFKLKIKPEEKEGLKKPEKEAEKNNISNQKEKEIHDIDPQKDSNKMNLILSLFDSDSEEGKDKGDDKGTQRESDKNI